jgi:hypothetical protein
MSEEKWTIEVFVRGWVAGKYHHETREAAEHDMKERKQLYGACGISYRLISPKPPGPQCPHPAAELVPGFMFDKVICTACGALLGMD